MSDDHRSIAADGTAAARLQRAEFEQHQRHLAGPIESFIISHSSIAINMSDINQPQQGQDNDHDEHVDGAHSIGGMQGADGERDDGAPRNNEVLLALAGVTTLVTANTELVLSERRERVCDRAILSTCVCGECVYAYVSCVSTCRAYE